MDFRKIDNLTVDCVVFAVKGGVLNVLLRKRRLNMYHESLPEIDDWVLPGHYVLKSNNLGQSADRIFKELMGEVNLNKKQFKTYGNPKRLNSDKDLLWVRSRGAKVRTVTVAYYLTTRANKIRFSGDDTMKWFKLDALPEIGFDHERIVADAYEDLKLKIITNPVAFDFLPMKFTLNELQVVYEAVLGVELDNRNFRKKALSKPYIVPLEEKKKGTAKKPSRLYMFSNDVYKEVAKKEHIVNV